MATVWNGTKWIDDRTGQPVSPQPAAPKQSGAAAPEQQGVPTPPGYVPPPSEYQAVTGPDGQRQLVSRTTGQPWSTAPVNQTTPTVASILQGALAQQQQSATQNRNDILNSGRPVIGDLNNAISGANAIDQYAVGGMQNNANQALGQYGAILGQAGNNANAANLQSGQLLAGLGGTYGQANAADLAGYSQLQNQLTPLMNPLYAQGYVGDVTSQGAQAYANPQDIAAQQGALGQFQNWMGGSANLQSQAAGAYADPEAIAAQKAGLGMAGNIAGGGLNVAADPESLAAQRDVMSRYKAGSDPTVTAQEQYIMELARQSGEQQERSSREAVMADLRARGMSGSGAELGSMLGAQQNIGQQRVLSDLGMQANAVARAERMLEGYGNTASTMRGQADSLNTNNANRQLQGTGLYVDAAGQIRGQSFDEAFNRGAATDAMGNANRDYQMMAGTQAGNLATNMRNAGFDESFKRGTAADDTAMFNKENLRLTQQFQDQYAQNEATRIARTGLDLSQAGRDTTQQIGNRAQNLADTGLSATNDAYGRNQDVTQAWYTTTNQNLQNQNDVLGAAQNAGQNAVGRAGTAANTTADWTRLLTGMNASDTAAQTAIRGQQAGEIAAQQALDAAGGGSGGSKSPTSNLLNSLFGIDIDPGRDWFGM